MNRTNKTILKKIKTDEDSNPTKEILKRKSDWMKEEKVSIYTSLHYPYLIGSG